jgi:hypothetical protein
MPSNVSADRTAGSGTPNLCHSSSKFSLNRTNARLAIAIAAWFVSATTTDRVMPSGGRSASARPSAAHSALYASVSGRTRSEGTSAIIGMFSRAHHSARSSVRVPYHSGGCGRCTGLVTTGAPSTW